MTLKKQTESSGTENGNPIGSERLLSTMNAVLPAPSINNARDAFTLFIHAFLVNVGFRFGRILHYSGRDGSRLEVGSPSQDQPSSSTAPNNRLPPTWNGSSADSVTELVYTHANHADTVFSFRTHVTGPHLHVVGTSQSSSRPLAPPPARLAQTPRDGRCSDGSRTATGRFLVANYPLSLASGEGIEAVFRDSTATSNLSADFQFYILQRLVPTLQHEGYTPLESPPPPSGNADGGKQSAHSIVADSTQSQQCVCGASIPAAGTQRDPEDEPPTRSLQEGQPLQVPLLPELATSTPLGPVIDDFTPPAAAPRPGAANVPGPTADFPPPGFEDEHQMLRATGPRPDIGDGSFNPSIGADDLNPPNLGPYDPLRPSLAGSGGLRIGPGGVGGVGGVGDGSFGGMHPTFDDPLFAGVRGQGGRGGGNGFFPQNPPGARWDDPGPAGMDPAGIYDEFGGEGMPQFPGGRGGRGGFGRGGGFGGGFGGGGGGFGGFGGPGGGGGGFA